ncbi:putative dual specificity protein phosphatase DSP8 [Dendrobium catenatum]|uniref:phosphatidylglycerophosphatase n=1 Tax=Dendrobium catenatum TaxID=906689 RepID=A0A2I0VU77_9ASPA|nr:putative dual specificity protein phosphatase DSP8 [Dendrobium catenatum]PKU66972.1 Putative dual specificity protein phosphatase DSP8 [Dendrobium catenatum]
MRITELEEGRSGSCFRDEIGTTRAKRVLVGLGARTLFYPTLFYNVLRNQIQSEFRWWDEVDQYLLLGAVPFQKDVLHLQKLGVKGVVTLNEPYETLVPSSLFKVHGIDNLVIPTRDYFFAPSLVDIFRAVDFIRRNASCGSTTYVHCKAGRGRSTTIVLCYLIEYKNMTPADALEYVRLRRPRVLLAPSQWQAVQEYYSKRRSEFPAKQSCSQKSWPAGDTVLITEADLEGYATSEDYYQDQIILLNSEKVVLAEASPTVSVLEDEVLITEKDLEGYESSRDKVSDDQRFSLFGLTRSRPMVSKLTCLFSSLKFSSSSSPATSLVHEVPAC